MTWEYQLRSIQFWSWLLSVQIPQLICEDVLSMKGPTVINCVASHIFFEVEEYNYVLEIEKLDDVDTVESGIIDQDLRP